MKKLNIKVGDIVCCTSKKDKVKEHYLILKKRTTIDAFDYYMIKDGYVGTAGYFTYIPDYILEIVS